jgi:transposase
MTRLYILSPSRSSAVPKEYFGYDQENNTHAHHKQVMADRYPGYSFLKALLDLAYCWAHVRRDFLEERSEEKDRAWADLWVARIGGIYSLNKARLALGCVLAPERALPAPFVELDAARMKSPEYQEADKRLREAVEQMAATRREELEGKDLRLPRRKVLQSLEAHWHGLTLFVDHPQIPMDNNGAERAVRPAAIARKNFYGSGAKWSGELMAMLMSLFQTLLLHQVDPRKYLTAYLQACADNSSQPPANIEPWLPWNFSIQKPSSQESGHIPGDVPGPSP